MSTSILTPFERELLQLVAEGLTNKEIGDRLDRSWKTVSNVLHGVYVKLDVLNRVQAVNEARERGEIE